MTEKIPQSQPETSPQPIFLVPRSNGEIHPARLTGKVSYNAVLQSNGLNKTIKLLEVRFADAVDDKGNSYEQTKMVKEKLLEGSVQTDLSTQLHDGLFDKVGDSENIANNAEHDVRSGQSVEQVGRAALRDVTARSSDDVAYDALFDPSLDLERERSVESAAVRHVPTEDEQRSAERRQDDMQVWNRNYENYLNEK